MTNEVLIFNNQKLKVYDRNGIRWLTASDIARALGYARDDIVSKLYNSHKDEFSVDMTENTELVFSGNLKKTTRIFSPRGCHLIAMFARTALAKEFRKWVLDVLEKYDQETLKQVQGDRLSVEVREHVRRLPSGKKEIVLSDKEHKAIGGIVKSCTAVAVREELKNLQNKEYDRDSVSKAFDLTTEEMIAEKQRERKQYMLSEAEVDIIEKIRSANAFNMLKMYMGVSDKLANNRF